MQFHSIKRKTENKKKMTVARGGKRGKTAGRGTKGQKSRSGHKIRPELRDMIKRIPKLRGRGKNSNLSIVLNKPEVVKLSTIEKNFENGSEVNPTTLKEKKIISVYKGKTPKIKILSSGKDDSFSKKIKVSKVAVSASAKALIEKAGGEILAK